MILLDEKATAIFESVLLEEGGERLAGELREMPGKGGTVHGGVIEHVLQGDGFLKVVADEIDRFGNDLTVTAGSRIPTDRARQ